MLGARVVFVVMLNEKDESGAYTTELNGNALLGLRGTREGMELPTKLSWMHTKSTVDGVEELKTITAKNGDLIENPADSIAREQSGGKQFCNNCCVVGGMHAKFPEGECAERDGSPSPGVL